MTNAVTSGIRNLNDCGCCEGLSVTTPVEIVNQPGLSAIAYRVGTHGQFKQSMLASLSSTQQPALIDLKTRRDDDLSIALLDAWAVVAGILTFYQERIANESYLRTATERRSVLELARSIGYELSPGLAASTYLAFTIDDAPGAPPQTTIDAGTRVQSIPGPGEQPQAFETIAPIQARVAWNALKPRLTKRHPLTENNGSTLLSTYYFDGIQTGLNLGDGLIILPPSQQSPPTPQKAIFCLVTDIAPQPELQRTAVVLRRVGTTAESFSISSALRARRTSSFLLAAGAGARLIPALRQRDGLGDDLNPGADGDPSDTTKKHFHGSTDSNDLNAAASAEDFPVADVFKNFVATQPPPSGVLVFRMRAAIFGHNAPKWDTLPTDLKNGPFKYGSNGDDWAEGTLKTYHINKDSNNLYLDTTYPNIAQGSYVLLRDGDTDALELHQVNATTEITVSDFTLTGKITRLTLGTGSNENRKNFGIRTTTIFGQSEIIRLARLPITDTVPTGPALDLEGLIDGLYAGQGLLLCGEPDNNRGNIECEYLTIKSIEYQTEGFTSLTLYGAGLRNTYVRDTVNISGNVAPATHGETRQEVLGSGNGSQPYQSFTLSQSPLTYTGSATASGTQSSLQVYVNDVLWHEVPAFYGHGPTERIYITRISDDGKTSVQFGDGNTGSRLPSGQNNVRAIYRNGIGSAGMVKANQLTMLLTRPPGLSGVTNPQSPTDAADPENRDDARQNAPLQVLTLDRIVSLRDYQDFARAFAGIAKALATWTWDGQRRGVFVTVAGPHGAAIEDGGALQTNLLAAMRKAGDPFISLQVRSYLKRFFRVAATVKVNPDYLLDKVAAAIDAEMHAHFSFDARSFGQQVTLSEVTAVVQNVTGVIAVEVTALYRSYPPPPPGQDVVVVNFVLAASIPQAGAAVDVPAAELLMLDPGPVSLTLTT